MAKPFAIFNSGVTTDTSPLITASNRLNAVVNTEDPTILYEDFHTYAVGPLGGQGLWPPQTGGANPQIKVVGGSLVDGVKSLQWFDTGGGVTTPGGTQFLLPTPILSNQTARISLRARVNVGAVMAVNTDPFISFAAGPMDLSGFSTDSFDISFKYDAGLVAQVVTVYDGTDPGGLEFNTGLAAGIPFTMRFELSGNGMYVGYINNGLSIPSRQMYPGNENIDRYFLAGTGTPPPDVIAIDSIRFEYTI